MMFIAPPDPDASLSPGLNVILATAHIPLARVPAALSAQRVADVCHLAAATLRRLGIDPPRLAVCGLNPHAGERGLLGDEDDRLIAPGVADARRGGLLVEGPFPADTVFHHALRFEGRPPPRFDAVVAMYHDQGLIPLKVLAFDRAVNLTTGLAVQGRPFFRTSPDHGTAYDIAGAARANPGSTRAALALAVRLASGG